MTDDVDIIDKLNRVGWSNSIGYSIDVSKEAVAEIERLRAALRRIGFDYVELSYEKVQYLYLEHMQIARDAYGKSFPLETDKPSDSPLDDNF